MGEEQVTLEEALRIANRLDPAERVKLRQALDQMTTETAEEDGEMIFKRALFEKGLISISEVRLPNNVSDVGEPRRPVPVKGKPVSETIIEDRG